MGTTGSVLNPGNIGGRPKSKEDPNNPDSEGKEVAKPFAKVEAKVNREFIDATVKVELGKYEIWDPEEISELPRKLKDERIRPDFEQKFKQKVGTEDVYLGLNENTPSSMDCREIIVTIELPSTEFSDINLEVTSTVLCVQTQRYYLHHYFPYSVLERQGKAQWVKDKCRLVITVDS